MNPVTGAIEFETVTERFKMTKEAGIREAVSRLPVHYFVFDVLQYNGEDVRSRQLIDRKKLLHEILANNPYFSRVTHVDGSGTALIELIQQRGLEGIVAKRKNSLY